jgi:hypothetical protein
MKIGTHNSKELNSAEKKMIRRQIVPSVLLAAGLMLIITLVNMTLHFMDVITGIQGVGRPPLSRFLIIEGVAVLLGVFTFLYLTRAVRKDLSSGQKIIEETKVKRKFAKRENGKVNFKVLLTNNLTVDVDQERYNSFLEGDTVTLHRSPWSELIFEINSLNN